MTDDAFEITGVTQQDAFIRHRNNLLADSDWTQLPDVPAASLGSATREDWATYRQQLRDLPANTTDPANAVWPTPPS